MRRLLCFEKRFDHRIRQQHAPGRNRQPSSADLGRARLRPRADLPDDPRGPFRPEQRFGLGEADSFGGAQPREEVFVEAVPFGKGFASGFGAPDVLRNGSDVPVTFPPVERVGGGADAQILRAVPVCGVVAGAESRAG